MCLDSRASLLLAAARGASALLPAYSTHGFFQPEHRHALTAAELRVSVAEPTVAYSREPRKRIRTTEHDLVWDLLFVTFSLPETAWLPRGGGPYFSASFWPSSRAVPL